MIKQLLLFGVIFGFVINSFSQISVDLVKDINPSGNSMPSKIGAFDWGILFFANDGTNNYQLWKSDGTEEGTDLVKIINPNGGSVPYYSIGSINEKMYFSVDDGVNNHQLWVSDGTETGTNLVKVINPTENCFTGGFTELNDKVYFYANDDINDFQLWETDGTEEGTQMVKLINPNGSAIGGYGTEFIRYKNKIYFEATNGIDGSQLWVTDGTEAGTTMLKIINTTGNAFIERLIIYNNNLYFSAIDGSNNQKHLWVTDGSESGTQKVLSYPNSPHGFKVFNGALYFTADNEDGRQLWVTDGTATGTIMVKKINPNGHSYPNGYTELNGKLYFSATDGTNGRQLWETDGTEEGTQLVKIINTTGDSSPSRFKEYGGKLYFIAVTDATLGQELYETDGTEAGTRVIAPDIAPNPNPCSATIGFYEANNSLYFTANFSSEGQELYKISDISLSVDNQPNLVKFKAFPNPTTDKLTIITEEYSSFSLLDITGKVLLTFDVDRHKEISTTKLATGVYLLKEKTTGAHTKIVKK